MTRSVWLAALRSDVSDVAVDTLLFHEAGRRLVHRYMVYKDAFPHPALRGVVIPRILSCVSRAMAIAQLTHLRISIPASGAPPGQVPADCFPGGAAQERRLSQHYLSFADEVSMLGDTSPSVCSPDPGVPIEFVPSAPAAGLPPPPGFSPFSWPVDDGGVDVDMSCFPFNENSSPSLSPIDPVCSDVSEIFSYRICCGRQWLLKLQCRTIVVRSQCLGGGWLGKQNGRGTVA